MGYTNVLQLEGPRLSFSQADSVPDIAIIAEKPNTNHLVMQEEDVRSAEKEDQEEGDNDTEFSFEFSSSMSLDLPFQHKMLSAEELFFNGKLRPLSEGSAALGQEKDVSLHEGNMYLPTVVFENRDTTRRNSDVEKKRERDVEFRAHLPMVRTSLHESLAMAKQHLRSLHESPRCLSMTIEGSRGHPRRSCVSLNSSRCSSPTRTRTSGTFSQPRTTPTSPKASSTQKSSKFLHFFKLKKHHNGSKEALLLSSENSTTSSSRLSRAFWPFSRSNSAGESKSSHGVSPIPKRSNSAGESKTTSSTLLPNNAINKCNGDANIRNDITTASLMHSSRKHQAIQSLITQQADYKTGLPPLHTSTTKKSSSCFVLSNCGTDSVALSHMADVGARCPIASTSYTSVPSSSTSRTCVEAANVVRAESEYEADHPAQYMDSDPSCVAEFNANSASPGRHVRHASASIPARHIRRGSPARQWSNPSMGSSTRSMQRFGPPHRGLNVRPKDALSRETASVRVAPVLNVPVCMTPSSKSKLFNLGNLFSKREKVARGYTMLVATNSQSGG